MVGRHSIGFVSHMPAAEIPRRINALRHTTRKEQDMGTTIDRRSFVKGFAAAGVAGLGASVLGCSPAAAGGDAPSDSAISSGDTVLSGENYAATKWDFEIPPDPIDESEISETVEADAIIIGSGLSGLTCANSAIESGVNVVLFSASDHPVARGGTNHSFNTKIQKARGIEYTPETVRKQFKFELHSYGGQINEKLWWRWVNNSEESQNWLIDIMESEGAEVTIEKPYVDDDGAYEQLPSALNFLIPEPSGELKEYMLSGAIQDIAAASNTGALAQAFVMAKKFTEAGGRIDYGRVAQYLEKDDSGRVISVIAKEKEGERYVRYVGKKAVVLATGDFSQNKSMMAKYCPLGLDYLADQPVDYNALDRFGGLMPGDGQKMGLWAGAAWQKTYPNASSIIDIMGAPTVQHMGFHPGLVMNVNGKRFMNEDTNAVESTPLCQREPQSTYFAIWDSDYVNHYDAWEQFGVTLDGDNGPKPKSPEEELARWEDAVETKLYFKADSIDGILEQLGDIDVAAAKATIEAYNVYCEKGIDEEFHKNPKHLAPIKAGPFYGFKRTINSARFLNVMGGLRTNENLQVCDENDEPIPGLYNIGCMIGDAYSNIYTFMFSGQSLGMTCDTFPYLLGRDLASGNLD